MRGCKPPLSVLECDGYAPSVNVHLRNHLIVADHKVALFNLCRADRHLCSLRKLARGMVFYVRSAFHTIRRARGGSFNFVVGELFPSVLCHISSVVICVFNTASMSAFYL